ncbi:MAG: hypothetical protein AAGC74_01935 [Verrucomicrobiota bacterium]
MEFLRKLLFPALCGLQSLLAQHPATESVTGFTVDSGDYVIASDASNAAAGYDRDTIATSGTFSTQLNSGQPAQTVTYRISYEMLSSTNAKVLLNTGSGNSTTWNVGTFPINLTPGTPSNINFGPNILPAETLAPNTDYRIRQIVEAQDPSTGKFFTVLTTETTPRRFYHFTNTANSDSEVNALITINSLQWNKRSALQSAATLAERSFTATLNVTFHRYDGFQNATPSNDLVFTQLNYGMNINTLNTNIPLNDSFHGPGIFVDQFVTSGSLKVPATRTVSLSFEFEPIAQIQSVTKAFYPFVTISHTEGSGTRTDGSTTGPAQQLLHMNGEVTNLTPAATITDLLTDPSLSFTADLTSITFSNRILDGFITSRPDLSLSSALNMTFDLFEDGHMEVSSVNSIEVSPSTDPIAGSADGFNFQRELMIYNGGTQLQSRIRLTLPAGLGYYFGDSAEPPARIFENELVSNSNLLDANLNPAATVTFTPIIPAGEDHIGFVEESKPLAVTCTNITWNRTTGELQPGAAAAGVDRILYLRRTEIDALAASSNLTSDDRALRSNELLYKNVREGIGTPRYTADTTNNSARISGNLELPASQFLAHFPYNATVDWNNLGTLALNDDLPTIASILPNTFRLLTPYARDCESLAPVGCGTIGNNTHWLSPTSGQTFLTPDGGLWATGTPIAAAGTRRDIQLSYLDALSSTTDTFTHQTSAFTTTGQFCMAGHFYDSSSISEAELGPAILLNSGFNLPTVSMHRPGTQDYLDGLADYPGINYRASTESAPTATATLGGNTTSAFPLRSRSKYYLRYSGTSGIHEADSGTFPSPINISAYPFDITNFGLSFLSNEIHESTTSGSIDFPLPSDFTYQFDSLRFDCLGLPADTPPASGTASQTLTYWAADIDLLGLDFQTASGSACDPSTAKAVVATRGYASNITDPLHGLLGIEPDGTLITAADAILDDIDSRFVLPNIFQINGPRDEAYNFTSLHHAWLNASDEPLTSSLAVGTLNLAGLLDVPFFEDLQVHLQTGARQNNSSDVIHMMAGFNDGDGFNPFTDSQFDLAHRSTPVTLQDYRDLLNPIHRPRALQDWLDIVPFDYPLEWNTTTRTFMAESPVTTDLMVVSAEHNLAYMSPEIAEIDFGADLNASLDIPEVNLENLASTVLDLSGLEAILIEHSTAALSDYLTDGIDSLAELANDRLDQLFNDTFVLINTPIDNLATQILNANENLNTIQTILDDELCQTTGSINTFLTELVDSSANAVNLLDEVDLTLARSQLAIRSLIGSIPSDPGDLDQYLDAIAPHLTVPEDAFDIGGDVAEGVFADQDGLGYDLLRALIADLIDELGGEAAAGLNALSGSILEAVGDELDALLEEARPTIEDVKLVLMEIHNTIGDIRTELQAGLGLAQDLQAQFADAVAEINTFLAEAKTELLAYLSEVRIPELDAEELKARIRQEIRDRFNASELIADIQVTLKQYVQDLEATANEAISSLFAEVNKIIVGIIADTLPQVQEELDGMLDDLDSVAATGNLDGHAIINGDALRTLRLDAAMQLKMPDPFEFSGYIEINQLDSQGDGGCSYELNDPNAYAAEVKLGANNIPVRFLTSDLRFDVGCKFSFDTDGGFPLRGMGGSLEMTEGEITVEAVTIFELGAAAAFGLDENYLAARVGFTFDQYTMAGGVFFGRACTLDPLLIADPDVGSVVGDPPFTGIYTYGEAQIPIVGASCLFSLQANAGGGVFVFSEGPTIGGIMKMGVTGKALCAVTIGGDLKLIGSKVGNQFNFFGRGRVFGEVGKDPLSVGFDEDVEVTFSDGQWDYDF